MPILWSPISENRTLLKRSTESLQVQKNNILQPPHINSTPLEKNIFKEKLKSTKTPIGLNI